MVLSFYLWFSLVLGCTEAVGENETATRVEALAVPFAPPVNVTFQTVEHGPCIGPIATYLLVCFLGIFGCFVPGVVFVLNNLGEADQISMFLRNRPSYTKLLDEDVWSDGKKRKTRLFWEGILMLSLPWLSLGVGALWLGLAHSRPPAWLLLLAAPAMARAVLLELRAEASLDHSRHLLALLTSKLELMDAVSDGLAVAAAAALPTQAHSRYAATLQQMPRLGPALTALGLTGGLAVALALATLVQASVLLSSVADIGTRRQPIAADMAGLGSLAVSLDAQNPSQPIFTTNDLGNTVYICLAKAVSEAAPQMLLQSSVLMAEGDGLLQQPTVLLSVFLSMGTLGQKAMQLAKSTRTMREPTSRFMALTPVALLIGVILFTGTKMLMIELCPDRLWSLSVGCLEEPAQ